MRQRLVLLAAGVFALGLLGPPANADTREFADGASTASPMNINSVTVKNERQLVISIRVDDLQRRPGSAVYVWIDTNARRAGPEFIVASGIYDSDWQIGRARNWQFAGTGPLNCWIDQQLDFDNELIRFKTGRNCLGNFSRVRVSVKTEGDNGTKDYSPLRRTFHPWVARY